MYFILENIFKTLKVLDFCPWLPLLFLSVNNSPFHLSSTLGVCYLPFFCVSLSFLFHRSVPVRFYTHSRKGKALLALGGKNLAATFDPKPFDTINAYLAGPQYLHKLITKTTGEVALKSGYIEERSVDRLVSLFVQTFVNFIEL